MPIPEPGSHGVEALPPPKPNEADVWHVDVDVDPNISKPKKVVKDKTITLFDENHAVCSTICSDIMEVCHHCKRDQVELITNAIDTYEAFFRGLPITILSRIRSYINSLENNMWKGYGV